MASLIVTSGPNSGAFLPLKGATNVIGRDESLPVQILGKDVSRKHIRISFDADQQRYYLEDVSATGTWVNGEKVEKRIALLDGDEILIGKTSLRFRMGDVHGHKDAREIPKQAGQRDVNTEWKS
jgi:pSer/pThr/pTyr-binding forkhead associated (FHA) protein